MFYLSTTIRYLIFFTYPSTPLFLFFFFLMIRPPPRSTLFPNPTLFRSILGTLTGHLVVVLRTGYSHRDVAAAKLEVLQRLPVRLLGAILNAVPAGAAYRYYSYYLPGRSEEHTSELQSQSNLVCRLLLEK